MHALNLSTRWNESEPAHATTASILYSIRKDDLNEGLLFDSVTMSDVLEGSEALNTLDALVVQYNQMDKKITQMKKAMNRAVTAVRVLQFTVSEPFKQKGVTQVASIFELTDGQTVTVYFHNPDRTPNKLTPTDEVVSWKWLLNKKDITIIVAPEQGKELNPIIVGQRIMMLAEKNSPAFIRRNGDKVARLARVEAIKNEIGQLQNELTQAQDDLADILSGKHNAAIETPASAPDVVNMPVEPEPIVVTGKELGDFPDTEEGKKALRKAAKEHLDSINGQCFPCPALHDKVEVRTTGIKKMISMSGDPKKLKLMAFIPKILLNAEKIDSKPTYLPEKEKSVKAYHYLKSSAKIGDKLLDVNVVVREDNDGKFYYDMTVKGVDESLLTKEKSPNKNELDSVTASNGYRDSLVSYQLDSSLSSTKIYVNMFIVGEEPEYVENEEDSLPDSSTDVTPQARSFANEHESELSGNFPSYESMSPKAKEAVNYVNEMQSKGGKSRGISLRGAGFGDDVVSELIQDYVKGGMSKSIPFYYSGKAIDYFGVDGKPTLKYDVSKASMPKQKPKTASEWMSIASNSAAVNDVRHYLNGTHITPDGKVVSTDGHRLTIVNGSPSDFNDIVQAYGGIPKEEKNKTYKTKHDDGYTIDSNGKFIEGTFPEWQRFLPKEPSQSDIYPIDILKLAAHAKSTTKIGSKVGFKLNPVNIELGDSIFMVNSRYAKEAAEIFIKAGYKKATAYTGSQNQLVIVSPDKKITHVIMGMKVSHSAFDPINITTATLDSLNEFSEFEDDDCFNDDDDNLVNKNNGDLFEFDNAFPESDLS